ncbi:2640_t:CDS:2 [Funneliformis geosporum]|uniref:2640_t:CDS:1 n=1 Tax=Funneliformis geosporum TaxID=1117311 RepID=A0A9W4WYF3_9GLOM|nr:2640_t:CDS:2 [Funneliformis geosporum]
MNLEQNPTNSNSQAELDSKKQQLKILETKPNKNPLEKVLLVDKKKELAELLHKKNNHPNSTILILLMLNPKSPEEKVEETLIILDELNFLTKESK